jgi:predicted transcriptional regulator
MARERKLEAPVTLFAAIETEQHQALREIAFEQRRSIADVVREAISQYVAKRPARTGRRRLVSGRR